MNAKDIYRQLCEEGKPIHLFDQASWLDAVGEENWDVVLAKKGNEILGAMPYFHKKKLGFNIITVPPLTPYLGPVLFYPEGQKAATRLSFEKEVMEMLIVQLPKTDKFIQYFHPNVKNGLPFQWKGFEQNVRYTYIIKNTSKVDDCWDGLQGNIRRAIKKAEAEFDLADVSAEDAHQIKLKDYADKKLELNYDQPYFEKIASSIIEAGTGKLIGAKNSTGELAGAILFGWDKESVYYVSGAADPKFRSSGVLSLLLWEGIKLASEKGLAFNFEGSMIESIERYFRSFGAEQVPYYEMKKIDSKVLGLIKS